MDKKLTDSEIVKALKSRMFKENKYMFSLLQNTLDLINRLQAEIKHLDDESDALRADIDFRDKEISELQAENERLKEENKILKRDNHFNESGIFNLLYGALVYSKTFKDYRKFRKDFKAEVYKEFANELKCRTHEISCNTLQVVTEYDIDNTLKELVGEKK